MKTLMLALVVSCLGVGYSRAADLVLGGDNSYCGDNFIKIHGAIRKGDAEKFKGLVETIDARTKRFGECYQYSDQPSVVLASKGGDLEEAVSIGVMVRQHNFKTLVHVDGCYSSCVLIFAAGVNRRVMRGKIGIHRPYLQAVDRKLSVSEINERRQKQTEVLKKYALWLDISPQLIDDMNAIPPEQVKILSEASMTRYRIVGEDPSFEEFRIGRLARLYNISSAEYRSSHFSAVKKCDRAPFEELSACIESEILGISTKDAKDRLERFYKCKTGRVNSADVDGCFRKYVTRITAD